MFAVASEYGRQYILEKGKIVEIDSCSQKVGTDFKFKNILFCHDGNSIVGVSKVNIKAKIVSCGKRDKLIVFKKQRRTCSFEKKRGHRTNYVGILVEEISCK